MNHRKSDVSTLLASLRAALAEMRYPARLSALGLGVLAPLAAFANPTGGQVVGGSATISTPSANGTLINQSSQRAVINWQQFSVGANQYVQFVQPNSSAVVLNRVIGSNPSSIFGNIMANGQVFLVNPNGILFAPGATLDVAGLVASTQGISNADFMAGQYNFSKAADTLNANVINEGSITAGPGGYVVLAGDYVQNGGHISAEGGRVYLAAGGSATLTMDNNGLISYSVNSATLARLAGAANVGDIVANGGAVVMTADVGNALTATAVNNQGFIAAHSIKNQSGEIILAATGGELVNGGTLDASATVNGVAGGTVLVRGDGETRLEPTSVITAAGDGARGGFIDLSGHDLAIHGQVTAGKGGSLLLDPTTLHIVTGPGNGNTAGATNSIGTGYIAARLNAGSNVTLVASGTVDNASGATRTISANSAAAASTRFRLATGTISSNCAAARNGACFGPSNFPSVSVGTGTINLTGLTIITNGQFLASAGQGLVTLDTVTAKSGIFVTGGQIQVNGNLTAAGGGLSINANRGTSTGAFIKTASGVKLSGGYVSLHLSGSYGGVISVGSISGGSANVSLNYNTLNSPTSPEKIFVNGNITGKHVSVNATGPKASISINGSIDAVNPTGVADVSITADGKGGKATVIVNGNITVSGKEASSGSGNALPFDLPLVAGLKIEAIGSGAGSHMASVNGNVSINAIGGTFSRTSTCECGPPKRLETGVGGVAAAYIIATGSHGVTSVNGSLSAKGPDAHVGLLAHKVMVNGNISVTGSGHHVTRTVSPETSTASYTSSNSAGQATLQLGGGQTFTGSPAVTTTILGNTVKVAGSITVAGKGVAEAAMFASNVSAGNISVTATAAQGKVKQKGITTGACTRFSANDCTDLDSIGFYRGIGRTAMHSGSINGGRAAIFVGGGTSFGGGSSGARAVNVKLGSLNVNGVGEAAILLDAKAVTTQALSAVATKGTEKGTGSSQSGVTAVNTFTHTFNINGGAAHIKIRSGNSGSHSSGVLTLNGGPITIGGNVNVTGPTADVDVKAKSIMIGGTVTVTGSGGSSTEKTVFTPAAGTGYTTSFSGVEPTRLNVQGGISGSVSVAGKTTVKGPGLVGVIAVGGTVKLNGFSGSASAVKNYSILDTRVSPTAVNFTAGSLAVIISDVAASGTKPVFTSGVDTGDMKFNAKGNVDLPSQLTVAGALTVQASGNIVGNSNGVVGRFNMIDSARPAANHNSASGPGSSVSLPHFSAHATSASLTAGGSLGLASVSLTVTKGVMLTAGTNIIVNKAAITAGSALIAVAGSNIGNGSVAGSVHAASASLKSTGGSIVLNGETLAIGTGGLTLSAAGGSLNLTAATLNAGKGVTLDASKHILMGKTIITAGSALIAVAGSNIGNGSVAGSVHAASASLKSTGGSIVLNGETFAIGTGGLTLSAAGGSLNLTAATLNAGKGVTLDASKHILMGKTIITAGSALSAAAGGSISNGGLAATLTATTAKFDAKGGNLELAGETLALGSGALTASANGNLILTGATVKAGTAHLVAAGSANLTGAALTVGHATQVLANKNIVLGGATIKAGTFDAVASGSVIDNSTSGSIAASAVAVIAGKNINLSGTKISIGKGGISSVHGDSTMLLGLRELGLSPASPNPNGAFIAAGTTTLGGLDLTGSYLLLQGTAVSVLGKVSVPTGAVVQVAPFNPNVNFDIENSSPAAAALAQGVRTEATSSTFVLTNQAFLSLFPGATIVVGEADDTGAATLGANGPFNIGSTNLIIETTGSVTGLSNVTSTGIVQLLFAVAGPPVPPVTTGEVDPSAGSGTNTGIGDQTDKRKIGSGGGDEGGGSQAPGTVSQDSGTASVCH